jgi:DNA mismatch repair protein MutH
MNINKKQYLIRGEKMNNRQYDTKAEVLARGKEAIGIPMKDIDKTGRLATGKGAIGSVIEESVFGYRINREAAPDFEKAGVELKVTPYIKTGNGIRAKERLVCNIIDYMKEYQNTFTNSSFFRKCNTMLILSYEHKSNVPKGDFTIDGAILFNFPEEDLVIIERDWNIIIDKVRSGKAHEISEGDTLYLGACTKGATAESTREQPFSTIRAKQRAYSLKQSYMTYILNAYVYGTQSNEHIIKNPNELKTVGFEEYLIEKIKPYIGLTQDELKKRFSIESKAKNVNELILAKMLEIKGKISKTEEFQKANIIPKTLRIQKSGAITENMSFDTFRFKELITEEWEDSTLKNYFEQTKFLFIIFRFDRAERLVFDNLMFWNMPEHDFKELQKVWKRTVKTIKDGVILLEVDSRIKNNFPKKTESGIAHVRPHSKKSAYKFGDEVVGNLNDANELPDGRWMTTQSFWLNNNYILKQIMKTER